MAVKQVKVKQDRLTDAYLNEAVDLQRYKGEMDKLRAQQEKLERIGQNIERRAKETQQSHYALEHLEKFCRQVARGLENLAFEEKQQLLRLVVERIVVDNGKVRIDTIIPTGQDDVKLRNARPELVEGRAGYSQKRLSVRGISLWQT